MGKALTFSKSKIDLAEIKMEKIRPKICCDRTDFEDSQSEWRGGGRKKKQTNWRAVRKYSETLELDWCQERRTLIGLDDSVAIPEITQKQIFMTPGVIKMS